MFYSPYEIAAKYPEIALGKVNTPNASVFWKAFLAGVEIAFAVMGAHMVTALLPDKGVAKLVAALLFPAGLAMVLVCGAELFTGNCMMPMAVLEKKITVPQMLRNWALVYAGNFAGSVLIAGLSVAARSSDAAFLDAAIHAAEAKAALSVSEAFLRALLCNTIVCGAIWMSYSTDSGIGKIAAMYFPVMLFVLCGLEHCVTNMYYFPAAFFANGFKTISLSKFLLGNLLPVTVGNILGGAVIFSGPLWLGLFRKH